MKKLLFILSLLACGIAKAQDFSEYSNAVKIGGGYAHDFPGMRGYSLFAEFSRPLTDKLQGAIGVKLSNMSGHPRTANVKEYTKASGIDFNLYFVPYSSESGELRIGAGYSFSFYNIRRSYPLTVTHGTERITTWPVQDQKARTSGLTLTGEYEYFIPGTNFSVGFRASLFKAYDQVGFAGVFGAIKI